MISRRAGPNPLIRYENSKSLGLGLNSREAVINFVKHSVEDSENWLPSIPSILLNASNASNSKLYWTGFP